MSIRRTVVILLLLVMNQLALWAQENFFAGWTDLVNSFADNNTGLRSFPTLLIPMGGIAEGMGTAYTAMSRDADYIEYNPAGSAVLPASELALYHHAWIADSNMEAAVYTRRFDDLGIGAAAKFLYVPFTAYNDWGAAVANNYISESVGTLNVSYNFLSNYYFSGVAVGANLKVAYRNIPDIASLSVYNQSALAVMGDVGAQTSFNLLKFYNSQSKNFSVASRREEPGDRNAVGRVSPADRHCRGWRGLLFGRGPWPWISTTRSAFPASLRPRSGTSRWARPSP